MGELMDSPNDSLDARVLLLVEHGVNPFDGQGAEAKDALRS